MKCGAVVSEATAHFDDVYEKIDMVFQLCDGIYRLQFRRMAV